MCYILLHAINTAYVMSPDSMVMRSMESKTVMCKAENCPSNTFIFYIPLKLKSRKPVLSLTCFTKIRQ